MLRLEVRNAETPIEKKPPWIKTRAKMGPEYRQLQALVKSEGLHTGLPGGRLPQHLRVLGGPRGHVLDRRRPVHPALRLLPDRHRQARATRCRRADAGRRERTGRCSCATPPSPASAATTSRTRAPGCTPRRSARSTNSTPASVSRCWRRTSPGRATSSGSCSTRPRRCSRTTSRPCRGSSAGSVPASATSGRST